jgi:hypothetical protein
MRRSVTRRVWRFANRAALLIEQAELTLEEASGVSPTATFGSTRRNGSAPSRSVGRRSVVNAAPEETLLARLGINGVK